MYPSHLCHSECNALKIREASYKRSTGFIERKTRLYSSNGSAFRNICQYQPNFWYFAKAARTAQEKSELVKVEGSIDISNVNVVCPTCGKPVRVKHAVVDGKKVRVCSCGASLDSKFVKDTKAKKTAKTEADETKKAEKPAKTEKKSKVTKSANAEEKATKVAVAKKPTTSRSSQRGV